MEGGQSSTYLRLMRASSGPRVSVAKTYRDETNVNEYFGQITVAFLSSRIQESLTRALADPRLSDAHPQAGRRSHQS